MATPAENLPVTTDSKALMQITKNPIVDYVFGQVEHFQREGLLTLPRDYSPKNALMSAYLKLVQTKNRDKQPVLTACTRTSIAQALLDMVVQGLTPAKNQVYFIAYGDQLACQRSYFGTEAVCKRVTKAQDIMAEVVYEGDMFEFDIKHGTKTVTKHTQTLDSLNSNIKAAYCVIVRPDGSTFTEIMTIQQIHRAWAKSQNKPFDDKGNVKSDSAHGQFPDQMAKKTVINRACKGFINSSDDSSLDLVVQTFNRTDDAIEEAEFRQEVAQNANGEVLELPATTEPEKTEPAPEPEKVEPPKPKETPKPATRQPGF